MRGNACQISRALASAPATCTRVEHTNTSQRRLQPLRHPCSSPSHPFFPLIPVSPPTCKLEPAATPPCLTHAWAPALLRTACAHSRHRWATHAGTLPTGRPQPAQLLTLSTLTPTQARAAQSRPPASPWTCRRAPRRCRAWWSPSGRPSPCRLRHTIKPSTCRRHSCRTTWPRRAVGRAPSSTRSPCPITATQPSLPQQSAGARQSHHTRHSIRVLAEQRCAPLATLYNGLAWV